MICAMPTRMYSADDAFAGCHLKDEVGQKQQTKEEQHVFKRAVYGLVWVCQLNK